jgi:hypothetical protein
LNARPNSIYCCFTWIGVHLWYGSTADQGRTGREGSSSRLWRPARALGTHAKQGPPTGHSAVGLRQARKCLLTPRPHFTAHYARLLARWLCFGRPSFSSGAPSDSCVPNPRGTGSDLLAEASTLGDRMLGGDRIAKHHRVQRAPPPHRSLPRHPYALLL